MQCQCYQCYYINDFISLLAKFPLPSSSKHYSNLSPILSFNTNKLFLSQFFQILIYFEFPTTRIAHLQTSIKYQRINLNNQHIGIMIPNPLIGISSYHNIMEQVHIGHYILGRTIGNGGFAKVKEAKHDLTGIKVAIKILNKRKMRNKNMISKVKREIKILKFISHPNIIKLYEVLDTTNDIFVVMQLAERGELFDYLQNNQISDDEAKFFFRQVVQGIAYAHSNLIAHRDLKPQNILIDSARVVKIVDFGLSNLMKDGRLLKTACGSPNYAAPEIVTEQKYEGTSVDVWSCGVILYALLVGRLPFYQQRVSLLYRKIQSGSYTIPQGINPMAADLIRRMLQVDPYKRIRIHQIKNHPWIRPYIPIYSKISLNVEPQKQESKQIDKQIFEQIKKYTYTNPLSKTDSKMRKSIRKRQEDSFVVAYQLLKDTKKNQKRAAALIKEITCTTPHNLLLHEIENIVVEVPYYKYTDFQFGKRFGRGIKALLHFVLMALKQMQIQYIVKNEQYCLKCLYYTHPEQMRPKQQQDMKMEEEEEKDKSEKQIEKERSEREAQKGESERGEKFTRKEVRFNLQVYSCGVTGVEHLIDLQLTQGHPLVFFRMAKTLYNMIQNLLNY